MARAFLIFFGCCLMLGACTQRSVCPAFQSAYIHDKDALRKKFSYFQEDSTPKMLTASKNKYLIAEPTPYRKKIRSLQTVAMKPVPVHVPDSILYGDSVSMEELDRAARSVIDSTFIADVPAAPKVTAEDSTYVISKDRELRLLKYNAPDSLVYDPVAEKYVAQKPEYYVKDVRLNIEQDNYMWYLRDHLVLPDVRLANIQQGSAKQAAAKENRKQKKKKKGGFFKNLFKKKKNEADSTAVPAPPKEEFDFIDTDSIAQVQPPAEEPEARKGFFSPRTKKQKGKKVQDDAITPSEKKKKKEPEPADELKKEEEEGSF